jgi:hypothetical protein
MGGKITRIEALDELKNLLSKEREIFEQLSELEHKRWAGWQRHLHTKCSRDEQGNLVIPAGYVENLERQIKAEFSELTEEEKSCDRKEVLKSWRLIAGLSE